MKKSKKKQKNKISLKSLGIIYFILILLMIFIVYVSKHPDLFIPKKSVVINGNKIGSVLGTGKNIGDKISLGDQNFYVVSNDGTNIEMLAECNLYIGGKIPAGDMPEIRFDQKKYGLQKCDEDVAHGGVEFSKNIYWNGYKEEEGQKYVYAYDNNSNLYQYVEQYVSYLNNKYAINASGKLLSKTQAENILYLHFTSKRKDYSWIFSTYYWLGSAIKSVNNVNEDSVFLMNDELGGEYCHLNSINMYQLYGVRPVITIPANLIS